MINQGDYFFCFENRCLITYCEAIRGGLGADVVRRAVKVKASLSELVVRLDRALAEAPLRLCLLEKGSSCRVLEHLADTLVGLGRALEVLVGVDPLPESLTLFGGNGLLAGLAELLDGLGVVAQILLAANEDNWDVTAEVENLRVPLLGNVVERIGGVDGEADQDDVRVGVGQGTETVIILLTSRIP